MSAEMPEINEEQLRLIRKIANSDYNRVVFVEPDSTMDDPDVFANLFQSHKNVDHITALGLLSNVTEDAKDLVDALVAPAIAEGKTPRKYRVFKITKEGQLMFDAMLSDNRPN